MTEYEERLLREKIANTIILGANPIERRHLEEFYRLKAVKEFERERRNKK